MRLDWERKGKRKVGRINENETFGRINENETFGRINENETFGRSDPVPVFSQRKSKLFQKSIMKELVYDGLCLTFFFRFLTGADVRFVRPSQKNLSFLSYIIRVVGIVCRP